MPAKLMIYGATGYTGKLTARTAGEQGLDCVLAGRNPEKLAQVADPLGYEYRAAELTDPEALAKALRGIAVVLHVAGPFAVTSRPMVDACLRAGVHYLDVTGEIDVFEACFLRDAEAKRAGIVMMPGVGFDVVPSDCLAAHVARRLPEAERLNLAIAGLAGVSRGTAKTAVGSLHRGTRARRGGRIVTLRKPPRQSFDFGEGERRAIAVSWGDVSTAFHSTGIGEITVFFEATDQLETLVRLGRWAGALLRLKAVQRLLEARIDRMPEGPTDAQREKGRAVLVAEARSASRRVISRLVTPEGYSLTAMSGIAIALKVLEGRWIPGFRTPSAALGPDFILEIDGCRREDVVPDECGP